VAASHGAIPKLRGGAGVSRARVPEFGGRGHRDRIILRATMNGAKPPDCYG
jgi:hypothetical protein